MSTVEGAEVIKSTIKIESSDIKNGMFTANFTFKVGKTTNVTFTIPLYGAILNDLIVTFPDGKTFNAQLTEYWEASDLVRRHKESSNTAAAVKLTTTPSYMKIELNSAPEDEIEMKLVCFIKTNGSGEWILPLVSTKNQTVIGKLRSPIMCNIPLDITEIESDQAGDPTRYSTFTWQGESVENICIRQGDVDIESKLVSGDQNSALSLYVKGPEETSRDPHYFAFLGDSSGSMQGERIKILKDAIVYFLQTLAAHAKNDDKIALFWFNTYTKPMFPTFITYREFKEMEEEWRNFIMREYADGCTELLPALDYISKMSGTNPTHIVVYTDSEVDLTQEEVSQWSLDNPNKKVSTLTLSDEANPVAGDLFAKETGGFSLHLLTAQLKGEALYGTMNNVMNILFHNVSHISAKIESDEAGSLTPWTIWGSTSGLIPSGETGQMYFVGNVIQTARITLTITNRDPTGKQLSDPETRVLNLSSTQDSAILKRAAHETKSHFMTNGIMTLPKWLMLHGLSHDKATTWVCLGQASREYETEEVVDEFDHDCGATRSLGGSYMPSYYFSNTRSDDYDYGNDRGGFGDSDEEDPKAVEDAVDAEMEEIYNTLSRPKSSISQYMKRFSSKENMFLDTNCSDISVAFIYKTRKLLVKNNIEITNNVLANFIAWVMLKKEFNKSMFGFYEKCAKKALEKFGIFNLCESLEKEMHIILKLV
jgi:hypothetical protein